MRALFSHCGFFRFRPVTRLVFAAGCCALFSCGTGTGPEPVPTYRVTEGACGDVVFAEMIGPDFTSAFNVVKDRKVRQLQRSDLVLEVYELEVVAGGGSA